MPCLAFQVWNGVKSTRMPGVAAKDTSQTEPAATKEPMLEERLAGVAGTSRMKAAATTRAEEYLF